MLPDTIFNQHKRHNLNCIIPNKLEVSAMLALSKRNAFFAAAIATVYFLVFGNFNQALKWCLIGLQTINREFPIVTDIILTIIGLYVVWKLLKMLFWFWYRFIIVTLKITLTVSLILVAFAVYLRGMERLFTKDIPYLLAIAQGELNGFNFKISFNWPSGNE